MKRRVAIVDYGSGNLRSVAKALETVGANVRLVSRPEELSQADSLVVPGVGAFGDCAASLRQVGLWEEIRSWLASGKPYLGICLGYQLLFETSEENEGIEGFGVFKGRVRRFSGQGLKVPHIGWNALKVRRDSQLYKGLEQGAYVYFVHSYYPCPEEDIVTSTADYGGDFAASVERGRIFATQFHPEKSQSVGLAILRNFIEVE